MGGKRSIAADVWSRFGTPKQYIEPFCGSAAILLAAPSHASLEVICDGSGFIANFWRAVKHQPVAVAEAADYPVCHVSMGAAHVWLMDQRARITAGLQDIEWPGDAKVAGRWLHGQCCWIGSGWCDWDRTAPANKEGKIPHISDAGMGIQAIGKIPHISNAGKGIQAIGQIPHIGDAGMGEQSMLTSGGRTAWRWLHKLAARLERVRIIHGDWSRCLNNHYGGNDTAVFLDPPYRGYEEHYGVDTPVADAVEAWARDNAHLRIALCGHRGDYQLPGWDAVEWSRDSNTYGSAKTKDEECIWYSPACLSRRHNDLFAYVGM
jgi:hypothetical protein